MGQVVDDGQDGVGALNVELGLERGLGKKVRADAPHSDAWKLGIEIRAAIRAAHPLRRLYQHRDGLPAQDFHRLRRVDRRGDVGCAMCGLSVVAMAVELHRRFAGNSQCDGAAAALNFDHGGLLLAVERKGA